MAVPRNSFYNHGSESKMIENIENNGDTMVSTKNKLPNGRAEYKETGCLATQSPSISLTDDQTILNIDGYTCSLADLKEHIIDSFMYRKHLQELIQKMEGGAK